MSKDNLINSSKNSFDLNSFNQEDRTILAGEVGGVILESVILRLITSLNDDDADKLEQYVETNPTTEVLMEYLEKNYSDFSKFLEEEIKGFREQVDFFMNTFEDSKYKE